MNITKAALKKRLPDKPETISFTVRKIPVETQEALKRLAEKYDCSLNKLLLAILDSAVSGQERKP